jgi:hypothetical protein
MALLAILLVFRHYLCIYLFKQPGLLIFLPLLYSSVSFKGTTTGDFSHLSLTWSSLRGSFLDVSDPDGSQIHQVLVGLARLPWRN